MKLFFITHLKQNANAKVHEWLGKIYDALAGVIYGHRSYGQIRALKQRFEIYIYADVIYVKGEWDFQTIIHGFCSGKKKNSICFFVISYIGQRTRNYCFSAHFFERKRNKYFFFFFCQSVLAQVILATCLCFSRVDYTEVRKGQ